MNKLYNIKRDIYSMKTRNECLEQSIKAKLDISLYNYETELNKLCDMLLCSNSSRVLKNIVKSQKKVTENGNN